MTLIELLYFVVVSDLALFASSWAYRREGLIWAAGVFGCVLGSGIWFFFSGTFYRVVGFIFRRPDLKD
jgi:hypothetical protein